MATNSTPAITAESHTACTLVPRKRWGNWKTTDAYRSLGKAVVQIEWWGRVGNKTHAHQSQQQLSGSMHEWSVARLGLMTVPHAHLDDRACKIQSDCGHNTMPHASLLEQIPGLRWHRCFDNQLCMLLVKNSHFLCYNRSKLR